MQFSMRTLLIGVTLFAVIAAVLPYSGPTSILLLLGLVAVLFVAPVCLATLAFYSRGYRRTLFSGAFAGSLSSFYVTSLALQYTTDLLALLTVYIVSGAAAGSCGFAALTTRRFLERRGWHLPATDDHSDSSQTKPKKR